MELTPQNSFAVSIENDWKGEPNNNTLSSYIQYQNLITSLSAERDKHIASPPVHLVVFTGKHTTKTRSISTPYIPAINTVHVEIHMADGQV